MKRIMGLIVLWLLLGQASGLFGKAEPGADGIAGDPAAPAGGTRAVRILATSDLHGKFMPWDYSMNRESSSGSAVQLATAIADWRTEHTLLVDAGDLIQGNFADLFVHGGVHPMVRAMNRMGYDVWVTGNHDYNYGMDVLRRTVQDLDATVLTGKKPTCIRKTTYGARCGRAGRP